MQELERITEIKKGNVIILKIKGKLDSELSPLIEKKACILMSPDQNKFLIDLSDVSYVNSAGLRMLLSVKKQLKGLKGKFVVCGLKNEVMEIIKICGFDHVLEIYDDEENSLKQF